MCTLVSQYTVSVVVGILHTAVEEKELANQEAKENEELMKTESLVAQEEPAVVPEEVQAEEPAVVPEEAVAIDETQEEPAVVPEEVQVPTDETQEEPAVVPEEVVATKTPIDEPQMVEETPEDEPPPIVEEPQAVEEEMVEELRNSKEGTSGESDLIELRAAQQQTSIDLSVKRLEEVKKEEGEDSEQRQTPVTDRNPTHEVCSVS